MRLLTRLASDGERASVVTEADEVIDVVDLVGDGPWTLSRLIDAGEPVQAGTEAHSDFPKAQCPRPSYVQLSRRGTIPAMERVYTTPLLDKLGLRPGMRVALIDIDDPDIRALIAERTSDVTEGWPDPDTDVVLLGADSTEALAPLAALATRIRPAGAVWVVSRKGNAATLRDVEVIDAAKAAGLVDNKVASFSATHTSLRLVIPVARRPR